MLSHVGLRSERLLYFGFLLILLCCAEIYLVETAAYFSNAQTRSLDTLIFVIEKERNNLIEAYEMQQRTAIPKSTKDHEIAEMRRKLGLAPQSDHNNDSTDNSYYEKLRKILTDISFVQGEEPTSHAAIDSKKSPDELINELKSIRDSNIKNTANVFGIETPRLLSFKYGSTDFKIPSQYLAIAILAIIQSLAMIWLGSLSMVICKCTR